MFDEVGKDFDEMHKLYKEDPEEFERLRKQILDQVIESSKDPKRSRAMQLELDQRLNQQPNNYARMIYIQKRMHDSLLKLREALNGMIEKK